METLRAVAEIVRTTAEPMSKEEINSYFLEMELSEEQQELIYQYLMTPSKENSMSQEDIDAEVATDANQAETEESNSEGELDDEELSDSRFFQMYLDDLEEIHPLDEKDEAQLYERLASGDESVIATLAENWLVRVLELAQEQVTMDEYLEDVIQEGNITVLLTLSSLCGAGKKDNYEEIISDAVLEAMNNYLVEELSDEMAIKSREKEET